MDDPKVESVPREPPRRFWPFAIVLLAALAWAGLTAPNAPLHPRWQQSLDAFRDAGSEGAGTGHNPQMADMMILRNDFRLSIARRQRMRLSPSQARRLIACLNGPVDELSQSEALDALTLAQRAGFLSPAQAHEAVGTCLAVLSRTPPPMVRLEGARFLSHSKDPRGIAALRLLLNDPIPKIRDAAKQSLAKGRF